MVPGHVLNHRAGQGIFLRFRHVDARFLPFRRLGVVVQEVLRLDIELAPGNALVIADAALGEVGADQGVEGGQGHAVIDPVVVRHGPPLGEHHSRTGGAEFTADGDDFVLRNAGNSRCPLRGGILDHRVPPFDEADGPLLPEHRFADHRLGFRLPVFFHGGALLAVSLLRQCLFGLRLLQGGDFFRDGLLRLGVALDALELLAQPVHFGLELGLVRRCLLGVLFRATVRLSAVSCWTSFQSSTSFSEKTASIDWPALKRLARSVKSPTNFLSHKPWVRMTWASATARAPSVPGLISNWRSAAAVEVETCTLTAVTLVRGALERMTPQACMLPLRGRPASRKLVPTTSI